MNKFKEIFWSDEHSQNHTVILVTILAAVAIISMISPNFFTYRNFVSILEQSALYLILAIGMTLIMVTGGIDVSVGSILGLSVAVIGFSFNVLDLPVPVVVLIALITGGLCGLTNGLFITKIKLPPIIATIATLNIFRGLSYMLVGDNIYYRFPQAFRSIATAKLFDIPSQVFIALAVALAVLFFLKYHYAGRYSVAIGSNIVASRLAGIRSNKVICLVYTIAGVLGGLAAIIMTAKLNSAQAVAGSGIELHIIAVTVIGGTSLAGGYGTILGTMMGTVLIAILENSLILMNVSYFWQKFVLGLMIVFAVALRTMRNQQKIKKSLKN